MRTTSLLIALIAMSACGSNSTGDPVDASSRPDADAPSTDALSEVEATDDAPTSADARDARRDALDAMMDASTDGLDAMMDAGGCPVDFTRYLPVQTPMNCPTSAVESRVRCDDIPLYGVCSWQQPMGFTSCTCYESMSGKEWRCFEGGSSSARCPLSAPSEGSSCAGSPPMNCAYPNQRCTCTGTSAAAWTCTEEPRPIWREVQRACPPAGVDESKVIKDLTDVEVRAWCEWFADPKGTTRPEMHPQFPEDSSSYAMHGMLDLVGDGLSGCVVDLPVEYCIRNMRLQACNATLQELDDCVETLVAGWDTTGIVGLGCAPYRRNPTCDRTIVVAPTPLDSIVKCEVPFR